MTVWPNLAKFNIFDKILKVLGNILSVHLVLGYILNLALQIPLRLTVLVIIPLSVGLPEYQACNTLGGLLKNCAANQTT